MQLTPAALFLTSLRIRDQIQGNGVNCNFMDLLEWALIASKKRLRKTSLATYRSWYGTYKTRLANPGPGKRPRQPGEESPAELLRALDGQGDYQTQKRTLALLGWIYRTLNKYGHALADPTLSVEKLYSTPAFATRQAMASEWSTRLVAAATHHAKGWKGIRLVAMVRVLTDAALKTSELIELKTDSLYGHDLSTLVVETGGSSRSFDLSSETSNSLSEWLKVHPAPLSAYLFVRSPAGLPMDPVTVWRQLFKVTETAGMNVGSHVGTSAIRATKAKELFNQGMSTQDIADFLGHELEGSTSELLTRVH